MSSTMEIRDGVIFNRGVYFDRETHIYRVKDGRTIPSLTQMLKADGLSAHLDKVPEETLTRKREWGNELHLALLKCENGYAFPEEFQPHVDDWQNTMRRMNWNCFWDNAELPMLGRYGGLIWGQTPDRASPEAVVEFKGTYSPHISHALQTAIQVLGCGYPQTTPRFVAYFDAKGLKKLHQCGETIKRYDQTINVWDEATRILFDHALEEKP